MFMWNYRMGLGNSQPKPLKGPRDKLKGDMRRVAGRYIRLKTTDRTADIIGCEMPFFGRWIDFQLTLTARLNWSNYGLVWCVRPYLPDTVLMRLKQDPGSSFVHFNWTNWFAVEVYKELEMNPERRHELILEFLAEERLLTVNPASRVVELDPSQVRSIPVEDEEKHLLPADRGQQLILNSGESLILPGYVQRGAMRYRVAERSGSSK